MTGTTLQLFHLDDLKERVQGHEPRFFEFLRQAKLSCAIYRLPAGARDLQAPHLEDEIYLVLDGRARLKIGAQQEEVKPGMVLFVPANSDHAFVNIEQDLTVLTVFSAPAKPWKE